jgi:hypothetical protein
MSVDMPLSSRINSLLVHSLASLSMACIFQLLLQRWDRALDKPDQARESDSDDIPTLMDDPESEYSVSDDDSEIHDIPDLEEDHEGADDGEREEVIDSESSDAIPKIDIGAEVRGGDGLQFSSKYPSLPP